ncbi:hypothetical protein ACWKS6_21695 [Bacillus cereus]
MCYVRLFKSSATKREDAQKRFEVSDQERIMKRITKKKQQTKVDRELNSIQ